MLHSKVFEIYKRIFWRDVENIEVWHPNGFGSVRIRYISGEEKVFTYENDNQWSLQTLNSFIENMTNNKLNGGN